MAYSFGLVWHYEKDKLQRWIWCGLFSGVIIMIGVSRNLSGCALRYDVIGGFSLALVWLVLLPS